MQSNPVSIRNVSKHKFKMHCGHFTLSFKDPVFIATKQKTGRSVKNMFYNNERI